MKTSTFFALLSTAVGVLAAPAEEAVHGPRRAPVSGPFAKDRNSGFSAQNVQSPWGGSVQEGRGWRTVTGTTVVPSVTGQSSSAGAAAWVGIDGTFLYILLTFPQTLTLLQATLAPVPSSRPVLSPGVMAMLRRGTNGGPMTPSTTAHDSPSRPAITSA